MARYIVIKTAYDSYKCHEYSVKNSRVYFNGRAINLANVMTITDKDGTVLYENVNVQKYVPPKSRIAEQPKKAAKKTKHSKEILVI